VQITHNKYTSSLIAICSIPNIPV